MTAVQEPWVASAAAIAHAGSLRLVPFAELLVGLLDAGISGTLRVTDDIGALIAVIGFEKGSPVAACLARPESTLHSSLIPLCARGDGTFAFHANRDELAGLSGVVRGHVDPLAIIAAAMRGPAREDAVQQALTHLRSGMLKLNPRAELDRYGFSADERNAIELLRSEPAPLAELEIQADLPLHTLRRLFYVLWITRALTVMPLTARAMSGTIAHAPPPPPEYSPTVAMPRVEAERPQLKSGPAPAMARRSSSAPPEARTAERALYRSAYGGLNSDQQVGRYHVQRPVDAQIELPAGAVELGLPRDLPPALLLWRDEILARQEATAQQSYYEMLEVSPEADEDVVERAYSELEKRFDPDALPDELAAVRDQARALCDDLRQARAVLCDPNCRADYDRDLRAGDGASAKQHALREFDSEAYYRRAEALLKRGDYSGALREIERAMQGGSQPRYDALYGWLVYLRGGTAGRVHPRAVQHIERALKVDPRCEQALYYKAALLKHSGEHAKAIAHFKRVLAQNPNHEQAARELRLYQLRGQTNAAGSLLNRLLGRRASEAPAKRKR